MDKKTVEIRATIDAEAWKQFRNLAGFIRVDVNELLTEIIKKRVDIGRKEVR